MHINQFSAGLMLSCALYSSFSTSPTYREKLYANRATGRRYFYRNSDRSLIEDKFKSEIMNGAYKRIFPEKKTKLMLFYFYT